MPNKQGDQKLDCTCPQGFSFCGKRGTFDSDLVMQKAIPKKKQIGELSI